MFPNVSPEVRAMAYVLPIVALSLGIVMSFMYPAPIPVEFFVYF